MNIHQGTIARGIRPLIMIGNGHHPQPCIHNYIEVSRHIDKDGVEIIIKKCTKCSLKKEKRIYYYQHVM